MKSSRAMLLVAMLFAVPAFASEAPADQTNTAGNSEQNIQNADQATANSSTANTGTLVPGANETTGQKVEEKANEVAIEVKAETKKVATEAKGLIATALDYGKMPFVFALATAPDYIAKNTLGKVAAMECLKGGNVASFLNNVWTGRAAVATTAAVITYLAWTAAQPQEDADNDDVFGTEYQ